MLDVCGAFRCDDQDQNCTDLCSKYGKSNGQQDPHIKTLLDRERNSKIFHKTSLLLTLKYVNFIFSNYIFSNEMKNKKSKAISILFMPFMKV